MANLKIGEHNELCVGIDLGTTNSVLATINEKPNGDIVSKVVDISRGVDMYNAVSGDAKITTMKRPTLPSCVYYRQEKNYEPMVGDFAKMQYSLRPHLVSKSIKSQMGEAVAKGLSPDVPDETPAQISSRILKHMLKEASKVYRCEITDAVITVPANFDSVMCEATRDAAELAGIKVRNADGSERPVLLSEPNAVIYDLINQIHNGEVSSRILDLSEKKRVLVFDMGGGTLDITMHEIKRREDNPEILKVDEIATNRYTLLGGDDFDEEIAKAMYVRYLKQYESHPDVVSMLRKKESVIMPQLRVYAENLKFAINDCCVDDYDSGWDDPEDENEIPVGGNMGGIGYSYDDTFTKEEVEGILSIFMAEELSYDDYRHIEKIASTKNMIYPILDVLKKASEKLNVVDVAVDAVIVNGGMSKYYMVTDRLKKFFGFEPIVALDPDQAVARGAAVYHYYLHQYEEMKDDMKMPGNLGECKGDLKPDTLLRGIQWGDKILNDSLYLGAKNGAVHKIIPTGAKLPYNSPVMTGFKIEHGQNRIAIPIKSQNLDGTYRTIANGYISFKQHYADGAYIAFMIRMGSSKVITMKAWTSRDVEGNEKIEGGYAEIAIQSSDKSGTGKKFMAPQGSVLQPGAEINNMLQLCQNYERCRRKVEKNNMAKRIAGCVNNICSAGNKKEFAESVLGALSEISSEEARLRLFTIARKIGFAWDEDEKKRLASICMSQIYAELHGFCMSGPKVSTNIQAILALCICADREQLEKIVSLHDSTKYRQACLYTHAQTGTALRWIQDEFEQDIKQAMCGHVNNLQFSAYALGVALRKGGAGNGKLSTQEKGKIVVKLCTAIESGKLTDEELTSCIISLGWICDQRDNTSEIAVNTVMRALCTIEHMQDYYSPFTVKKQEKAMRVARKMVIGESLNVEEEQFLLTKLEK